MRVIVSPSKINSQLSAPSSKSSMQRACAAALLHNGTTFIYNAGISNDDKAALNIIEHLGAKIKYEVDKIIIESKGFTAADVIKNNQISCGESGLSFRMFAPIVALSSGTINLTGSGSLLKRPMNFFDDIFPQLQISIQSNNGFLPLQITGPLQPKDILIDGSLSSQYLTGLLFAFGDAAKQQANIHVKNLKSAPYVNLTLDVMRRFGYNIINNNYQHFVVNPKFVTEKLIEYTVEGDWSSASFLLVAGAISGSVQVKGLDENSTQADKAILIALEDCGAVISKKQNAIKISKAELKSFEFNATDCPDLFPPLAVLAAYCKGTTIIKGTHRLVAKESNRADTLKDIFGKMGIEIILKEDEMHITGGEIKTAIVSSHHDHRIAMAAAVAALGATGSIEIENADAINKSYPQFYNDLKNMGTEITFIEE